MPYQFNFWLLAEHAPALAEAAVQTVVISAESMLGGLAIGLGGAFLLTFGPRGARWLVTSFVELIRNTPLLAQLFLLFFALPQFGIRLSPHAAGVIGLSVNCGAYATEILRAGILSVSRGQIEAATALGLRRAQIFRFVILVPALQAIYPALASQFIIVLLSSSIVSSLSVVELTATAASLQMATFRAFEIYFAVTLIYLALSVGFRAVLGIVYRLLIERQGGRLQAAAPVIRQFTMEHVWFLVGALRWTIVLSLIAFLGGAIGGLLLALAALSRRPAVKWARTAFVELFQGTPLLMQLFTIYFGLSLAGLDVGAWTAVSVALTLNASAFLGEIWRGCIEAIPRAQTEAGWALGLHRGRILQLIVLPQALRIAVAPTVGFLVQIVKGTSLASLVNFVELMRAGQIVNNVTFRPAIVYSIVVALYFVVCWSLSLTSRALERRLGGPHLHVRTSV